MPRPFYNKQKEYKMLISDYKLKNLLQLSESSLSSFNFIGQIYYVLKIDGDVGMTYKHPNLKYLIEFAHRQTFER